MCSRSGEWKQGRLDRFGHTLGFAPERYIVPGMSGSPIVSAAGAAIGIISTGSEESVDAAFDGLNGTQSGALGLPASVAYQATRGAFMNAKPGSGGGSRHCCGSVDPLHTHRCVPI